MEPRAIVSRIRRSVGEDHPALVPALIAFANIREVYATLAISAMTRVVQQVYAALVTVVQCNVSVIPREYRAALIKLESMNYILISTRFPYRVSRFRKLCKHS